MRVFLSILLSLLLLNISFSALALELPAAIEKEKSTNKTNIGILEKSSVENVKNYKPIYFAYGEPYSKVQFSFRSELSDEYPLNFGYTQIVFWELTKESSPFLDSTYNPEFFYRLQAGEKWSALDLGLFEHHSNGKDGDESRSYDSSYLRAVYTTAGKGWTSAFALKLKLLYNFEEQNKDINEYIGPVEFDMRFMHLLDAILDESELILSIRPGGKIGTAFEKGGYQIAINYNLKWLKANPSFYIQYYYGYAETLLNYNENVKSIRIGLMF